MQHQYYGYTCSPAGQGMLQTQPGSAFGKELGESCGIFQCSGGR